MTLTRRLLILFAFSLGLVFCDDAFADTQAYREVAKPRLLLSGERRVGDVHVLLSVTDQSEVRDDPNVAMTLGLLSVAVVVWRGPRETPDKLGRIARRPTYEGPLRLTLHRSDGAVLTHDFAGPNEPRSTPLRTIYRLDLNSSLGDVEQVTLAPIGGYTDDSLAFRVRDSRQSGPPAFFYLAGGVFFFAGLMAVGSGIGERV